MKIKSFTSVRVVLSAIVLLTSCTQGPSKETLEAVAALKKIQAGTQVGVNYQTYGQLLIEAKAKTNEAVRSLPEGSLKTELTGAMDAYADAAHFWSMKIGGRDVLWLQLSESDKKLGKKYAIPEPDSAWSSFNVDGALQVIWLRANTHLDQISKLVGQEEAKPTP